MTEMELWEALGGDRMARMTLNALLRKYGRGVITAEFLHKERYYLSDIRTIGPMGLARIDAFIEKAASDTPEKP